jgi:hypothetical protein
VQVKKYFVKLVAGDDERNQGVCILQARGGGDGSGQEEEGKMTSRMPVIRETNHESERDVMEGKEETGRGEEDDDDDDYDDDDGRNGKK